MQTSIRGPQVTSRSNVRVSTAGGSGSQTAVHVNPYTRIDGGSVHISPPPSHPPVPPSMMSPSRPMMSPSRPMMSPSRPMMSPSQNPGHMVPGQIMPGHMVPGQIMPGHMVPGQSPRPSPMPGVPNRRASIAMELRYREMMRKIDAAEHFLALAKRVIEH